MHLLDWQLVSLPPLPGHYSNKTWEGFDWGNKSLLSLWQAATYEVGGEVEIPVDQRLCQAHVVQFESLTNLTSEEWKDSSISLVASLNRNGSAVAHR